VSRRKRASQARVRSTCGDRDPAGTCQAGVRCGRVGRPRPPRGVSWRTLAPFGARLELAASCGLSREDLVPQRVLPLTGQRCTTTPRDRTPSGATPTVGTPRLTPTALLTAMADPAWGTFCLYLATGVDVDASISTEFLPRANQKVDRSNRYENLLGSCL
jgi:hypothetical protein